MSLHMETCSELFPTRVHNSLHVKHNILIHNFEPFISFIIITIIITFSWRKNQTKEKVFLAETKTKLRIL